MVPRGVPAQGLLAIWASVTGPVPDPHGVVFTAAGQPCFYCDAPLTDPSVHWMGSTGDVYLHPRCVWPLFLGLLRDVFEIETSPADDRATAADDQGGRAA